MDPRDDDIEFDFFEDEPATTEAQSAQPRVRLPRRGGDGTGSRRPAGPRNLTPLVRLLAAITVLVALFVVFGLAIQSCASTSKHDTYANYMNDVAKIAHSSQDDGNAVANALTTAGSKASSLSSTLTGIAEQERQNVAQAQKLDPPGPLRPENQQLIEALELRISGVQGLASAIGQLGSSTSTTDAGVLSEQADRLLAGDIVWSDLFQAPAAAEMRKQGVQGVAPPSSKFVTNPQLISETTMSGVITRLKGATTGGKVSGLHGTNLESVKAVPGNQTLSPSTENTVTATTSLGFVVTIKDSGNFQEVDIPITLTIQQNPAIVRTQKIAVINPGQVKSVTFSNLGTVKFAQKETLLVDVKPVKGEARVDNNKGSYQVIFSLG